MTSLAYVFPYAWFFWAIFLFAFLPEFSLIARSKPAPGETADRGSMNLIILSGWIGMFIAFAVAWISTFLLVRGQKIWFCLGLIFLLLGSFLRRHCFKMLGRHFTGNVKVTSDQPVIQVGAYRWIRHPSYTGGMLMFLGTGLGLTNWLSIVVLMIASGLSYAYRVRVEEGALQAALGQPYRDYMQRTKRFIPFVF
jgi:protein-S-isoprenylcysteine O-methyltransferase Ste14